MRDFLGPSFFFVFVLDQDALAYAANQAWHDMVWSGVLVPYHLYLILEAISHKKGAEHTHQTFLCTYVLGTAYLWLMKKK